MRCYAFTECNISLLANEFNYGMLSRWAWNVDVSDRTYNCVAYFSDNFSVCLIGVVVQDED